MFNSGKARWVLFVVASLITASGGLILGRLKEGDYVSKLYARTDFMLMDSESNFFRLRELPEGKLLLLVFTPDVLHPDLVKTFSAFSNSINDFRRQNIDVMMISRTNGEVAKNFKNASKFSSRLLLDPSGTVGRQLGVWPEFATAQWAYALIDSSYQMYWSEKADAPLSYKDVISKLRETSTSKKSSSGSP